MSKLTPLFAAAAVIAGIVSASLWQQLRAERETSRLLRERVTQSEIARSMVAVEPVRPVEPTVQSQSRVAGWHADEARAPAPMVAPASLAQPNPMKIPEYREEQRLMARNSLPRRYPGLARALQLTPQETDALFDLLAKHQIDSMVIAADINWADPEASETVAQRAAAQNAEIATLLGARYSQWQNYQETVSFRHQVGQWDQTLAASGLGLRDEQTNALVAAMAAEQGRSPLQISMQEMQDLQDGRFSTEGASRSAESHHRALEAAASALDRQQLRALERLIDAQLAELRATERSRRAQREAQGRAGGIPGTVR